MIKIIAAAAIVFAGAVLSTSAGASSYSAIYIFKDIGGAPGHHRSQSVKLGDMQACGASRDNIVARSKLHAMLNCMQAKGWVVSRVERVAPEKAPAPIWAQSDNGNDQATDDDQASDDSSWQTQEEDQANEEAADESAAATQAQVNDEENAAMAEVGADTQAQGQAQQEAADLAEAEAPMAQQ
jgi:hypothetical protein